MADFSTTGYYNLFSLDNTAKSALWSFDDKTQADSSYLYYSYPLLDVTSTYYFIRQEENDFTDLYKGILSPDNSVAFRIYDTSLATIGNTADYPIVCQGFSYNAFISTVEEFLRSPWTIDDTTGGGGVFSPIGGDHIIKVSEIK